MKSAIIRIFMRFIAFPVGDRKAVVECASLFNFWIHSRYCSLYEIKLNDFIKEVVVFITLFFNEIL